MVIPAVNLMDGLITLVRRSFLIWRGRIRAGFMVRFLSSLGPHPVSEGNRTKGYGERWIRYASSCEYNLNCLVKNDVSVRGDVHCAGMNFHVGDYADTYELAPVGIGVVFRADLGLCSSGQINR